LRYNKNMEYIRLQLAFDIAEATGANIEDD